MRHYEVHYEVMRGATRTACLCCCVRTVATRTQLRRAHTAAARAVPCVANGGSSTGSAGGTANGGNGTARRRRVDWHGGDSGHDGGVIATNLQHDTCERDVARGVLRRSHLCRQHAGQRRACDRRTGAGMNVHTALMGAAAHVIARPTS